MRQLRHPALTLFLGVSLADPHLCIVTELVSRGALFDLLQEEATGYTWRRGVQIAVDIASGMTYLHSHVPKIIHRDLKVGFNKRTVGLMPALSSLASGHSAH